MPQLRKNPVTREWVIIASERAKRPCDFFHGEKLRGSLPLYSASCPFCPGNEHMTPPAILAYRHNDGTAGPDGPGWWIRVVPNLYPALAIEGGLGKVGLGLYDLMNGVGAHEVIIETPEHNKTFATMSEQQVADIIWAYRDRYLDLKRDRRFEYILIFRNFGETAGASLEHPHSQLIATPIVPIEATEELEGAARYYDFHDRCAFCDMVHQELDTGERLVLENEYFVAFEPFAAKYPFETWIVPKTHDPNFADMSKEEVGGFARAIRDCMARMALCLNQPPYNFTLLTAPLQMEGGKTSQTYHWHLKILPRLTVEAGFEKGSGIFINVVPPEQAAQALRDAVAAPAPPIPQESVAV